MEELSQLYSNDNLGSILVFTSLMTSLHSQLFRKIDILCPKLNPLCITHYTLNYLGILNWMSSSIITLITFIFKNNDKLTYVLINRSILLSFSNTLLYMFISSIEESIIPVSSVICAYIFIIWITMLYLIHREKNIIIAEAEAEREAQVV